MPPQNYDDRFNRLDEKLGKLAEKLKRLDDLYENQTYLKNSLDTIKSEMKSFKQDQLDLKKEVDDLKVKVNTIQADNLVLKKEAAEAKGLADEIAQSRLLNEAMVNGLPLPLQGNPKDIIMEMIRKLNISIGVDDISEVVKIEMKSKASMASLKVKFVTNSKCADFIYAAKKKRFKASDLGYANSNLMIFVNESLTESRRKLFFEARRFKLEKNYKFVWVKMGKIFLRLSENERPIMVRNLEDIMILRR